MGNTNQQVWFVTGSGRGMGANIAKAALAAGNNVIATGRSPEKVQSALGESDNLLVLQLDVTNPDEAAAATRTAIDRFGRIDVLVNNAASFYGGYFEELMLSQIRNQLETSLLGPMNVTKAVLPFMRQQRSGHIFSISSGAGLSGFEFNSAYCAAKFGLEGWMESLEPEISPFGIRTTIVNPGFFRTELLTPDSAVFADSSIPEYSQRHEERVRWYEDMNGHQPGDPDKLAEALLLIANMDEPPVRFIALSEIVDLAIQKSDSLRQQAYAYKELSCALAFGSDENGTEPRSSL